MKPRSGHLAGRKPGDRPRAILAAALGATLVAAIAPIASSASSAPSLGSVSAEVGENNATLEAQIRPDGLETTYKFWVERPACEPPSAACESAVAEKVVQVRISADRLEQTVSVELSGLEWSHEYPYWVTASNSKGTKTVRSSFVTSSPPPPGAPEGSGGGPPYESPQEGRVEEGAREEAEEAPRLEAEREAQKKAEEGRLANSEANPSSTPYATCLVPSLKGDTLRAAHAALRRRHCRLGSVARPRGRRARLVVVGQNRSQGMRLPAWEEIDIRLGYR